MKYEAARYCVLAVSGCTETDVYIFHTKRVGDYLDNIGSILIKKGFTSNIGSIVTKRGFTDIGGIKALRKVQAPKRIPLCNTHFDMLELGEPLVRNHEQIR